MTFPDPRADESVHDQLWPRVALYRYRLYVRRGDELDVLAACPTMGGIGIAILELHKDCKAVGRRLADEGVVGILDAVAREWIVLPWERPEEPTTVGEIPRRVKL